MELEEEEKIKKCSEKKDSQMFILPPAINFRNFKKIQFKNNSSNYKIKIKNSDNNFKYVDSGNTITLPKIKYSKFKDIS